MKRLEKYKKNCGINMTDRDMAFIDYINKKCDMTVVMIKHSNVHYLLVNLWLVFKDTEKDKWLKKVAKESYAFPALNTPGRYSQEVFDFAEMLLDEFIDFYGMDKSLKPEAAIHIYDLDYLMKSLLYGSISNEIKNSGLLKKICPTAILIVDYEPAITLMFREDSEFYDFKKHEKKFIKFCNKAMKKHCDGDKCEPVLIKYLLRSQMDPIQWNDYCMR